MKSFVVIGAGKFGTRVAKVISESGCDVLAIDQDEEKVQNISDIVTHAVRIHSLEEGVLRSLGVRNFDVGIVALGDLGASTLVTLILKELGVPYIVARAQSLTHFKILQKVGADKVIFPENDMAIKVAHELVGSNVLDFIELSHNCGIIEVKTPKKWIGRSVANIDVRNRYNINIIAIKNSDNIDISVSPDKKLASDDILVIIGSNEDVNKI